MNAAGVPGRCMAVCITLVPAAALERRHPPQNRNAFQTSRL
jgi:hypothetical protein